jgi:diadenosine tetraphosphate (Ap4A) HIT family hydrolase
MAIIYESKSFIVLSAETPLVDRNDGGHIIIEPKEKVSKRQDLSASQAIELMRLTIIAGAAMEKVMNQNGVDIGRINYQDNGNWSVFKSQGPHLHYHLYGRAKSAKIQKYGQTLSMPHIEDHPGYYKDLKPLFKEDVYGIRNEIEQQLKEEKYFDQNWHYS